MSPLGPLCPRNWYLLAYSSEVALGGVVSRWLGTREIVLYRGRKSGDVSALDAHCAHMGCHLGHGEVLADGLRCALHHRFISPDGRFLKQDRTPYAGLEQAVYAVSEKMGGIFVFAGDRPDFAVPEPSMGHLGTPATSSVGVHDFALSWQALIANGMDVEHLEAVHERRLLAPPTFERLGSNQMQLRYLTEPLGSGIGDRITRWIARDGVHGSIKCIAGSMILVESRVGRHDAFILLSMCPAERGRTQIRGIAGVPWRTNRLISRLAAAASAFLFKEFLKKDVGVLQGLDWKEPKHVATTGDGYTRMLCDFFRALPAFDQTTRQPLAARQARAS